MSLIRCAARSLVPVAVATLIAGCALGPNYKRPTAEVTAQFKNPVSTTGQVPSDQWWTLFGDTVLNDLEAQVEVSNQNIAQAAAAYMQARAVVRQDRSNLLPSVGVSGGVTRSGGGSFSSGGSSTSTTYQLSPSASWELDVWGRLRRTLENAHAGAQASAADLANAKLTAQSQLAIAYLQLRGADAQRRLLSDTEVAYARTLTITQNRYTVGTAARTDVLQAQTQMYSAQDQEQSEVLQRAQLENAIAALVGKSASGFTIAPRDNWDISVPQIPAGMPSELLLRRPDVSAAERQMAAANATIGVQEANFFPAITLTSSLDFVSTIAASSAIFDTHSQSHSIAGQLSQTLLDFGGRRAQVDAARNSYAQAVASYRQSVLTAFQDIENDLAAADIYKKEFDIRSKNSEAADLTEKLTLNQYKAGTVDFTTVVVEQTAALNSRLQLAQIKVSQQTNAVSLITDLGGGWKAPDYSHYQ